MKFLELTTLRNVKRFINVNQIVSFSSDKKDQVTIRFTDQKTVLYSLCINKSIE